jgi:PPOX class probable F420-dependent enzyme
MTSLEPFVAIAREVQFLAVASTLRADGSIQSSLVNAGVLPSPLDGQPVLSFVTYGRVKLANLRARRQLTLTTYAGWRFCTVEGQATVVGPDDPHDELDAERLRILLREVFAAAGGTHDNWAEYDRVMRDERRAAVLVAPTRIYPLR